MILSVPHNTYQKNTELKQEIKLVSNIHNLGNFSLSEYWKKMSEVPQNIVLCNKHSENKSSSFNARANF